MIVRRKHGVSLMFIPSLQLRRSMHKGCKIYSLLALNDKGLAKDLLVVREFMDVFPEELHGLPPKERWNLPSTQKLEPN